MSLTPRLPALAALVLLASCATLPTERSAAPPGLAAAAPARAYLCRGGGVTILADFAGARAGDCSIAGDGRFVLTIAPEHAPPINPSPWYAFRIEGASGPVPIELRYHHAGHRYRPAISADGREWRKLEASEVHSGVEEASAYARFTVPASGRWVAAQPIMDSAAQSRWLAHLARERGLAVERIGLSHDAKPIELLDSAPGGSQPRVLVLLGGQHPPEVTGQWAMRTFLETLLGDTPLAGEFRKRVRIVAVPSLNPDGVDRGHWRANLGGTDLNRDWGEFSQPETRAVRDWLEREGIAPSVMIDFHSTQRNLFYVQGPEEPTAPADFAQDWLGRGAQGAPDYRFTIEPTNANPQAGTSKNWFYARWGIPAMTYEVGDETSREEATAGAAALARGLMQLMLERPEG